MRLTKNEFLLVLMRYGLTQQKAAEIMEVPTIEYIHCYDGVEVFLDRFLPGDQYGWVQQAREGKYDHALELFIRLKGSCTFRDIQLALSRWGMDVDGDESYGIPQYKIIFWKDMSDRLVKMIYNLALQKKIVLETTDAKDYAPFVLDMPVAEKVRSFDRPHWVPTRLYWGRQCLRNNG